MACPKCGCRLLTKVGRSKTMRICSDCGHPRLPTPESEVVLWRQLSSVLLLGAVATVALALSLLSDSLMQGDIALGEPSRLDRSNEVPAQSKAKAAN
jgi:hypothetical protein